MFLNYSTHPQLVTHPLGVFPLTGPPRSPGGEPQRAHWLRGQWPRSPTYGGATDGWMDGWFPASLKPTMPTEPPPTGFEGSPGAQQSHENHT